MNKAEELSKRMIRYLEKQDTWVSKKELYDLARGKSYRYADIQDACSILDLTTNVGVRYEDGTWYRYYPMTDDEIDILQAQLQYFDEMDRDDDDDDDDDRR